MCPLVAPAGAAMMLQASWLPQWCCEAYTRTTAGPHSVAGRSAGPGSPSSVGPILCSWATLRTYACNRLAPDRLCRARKTPPAPFRQAPHLGRPRLARPRGPRGHSPDRRHRASQISLTAAAFGGNSATPLGAPF
ncbi:hypothetical protein NDU88_004235 [Pleurodeles waltl]|uniref:Secreted protein n=1 Tax=Pleurodeles waltl TaxID=8319 RepID=A0AAV7T904_PLEWA|nr:hypothetical protein NDU88_004235 [Pleurodeles waltl]